MSEGNESDGQATYQIRVQGKLDERWADWFNGMTITFESGITTLTGAVADQAKLRGVLSKIWDLNLTLISVNQTELGQPKIPRAPMSKGTRGDS